MFFKTSRVLLLAILLIGLLSNVGLSLAQELDPADPPPVVVVEPAGVDELIFVGVLILLLVVLLGASWLIRNELIKAHASIPPEVLQVFQAGLTEALEIAKSAAARTPNTIDDRLVKLIDDLIAAQKSPPPGHNPQPEPPPDMPTSGRALPFLPDDSPLPYSER